jgi:hypothetical protein
VYTGVEQLPNTGSSEGEPLWNCLNDGMWPSDSVARLERHLDVLFFMVTL